ncbi:HDOD domain-containing protein [Ningiella sp. W23]|uniref:HDOD domain-containing protein n=1 Tax=Ningiella sp. W23 TaxID=3023715 RepID=UPI003756DE95
MSVASIVKLASQSFTLPHTCVRLQTLLDDPKSDIDDLAQVMSLDPSMTAKVLKLANSALFRFPAQVSSVPKALSIIGGEAAYNISMAETANNAFRAFDSSLIDFEKFWYKAVLSGLVAKALAQQKQVRGSERYFVLGILQHLSELICAAHMPEKYINYLELSDTILPAQAQVEVFDFTFAQCSGLILEKWNLPESLHLPLSQVDLSHSPLQSFEASILYTSQIMAHFEDGRGVTSHQGVCSETLKMIGLQEYEYDIIIEFALAESLKIAASLK